MRKETKMRRLVLLLATVGAMLTLYVGAASAQTAPQGTLDANNLNGQQFYEFGSCRLASGEEIATAQQFTAESTGRLTSAQVRLSERNLDLGSLTGSFIMEITEAQPSGTFAGDIPGRVLASTTIPASEITDPLVTGIFSSPAQVVAGQRYVLLLRSDSTTCDYQFALSLDSYLGEDAWALTGSPSGSWAGYSVLDLIFATYVTPPDTTAPTTTATLTPEPNEDGWNNSDTVVSLSAEDQAGSGIDKITYSTSGAQIIAQTDASGDSVDITLDQEGTTTLTYYATDKAGNVEDQKTLTVKIDKTAPTITNLGPTTQPNALGWYKTDVTNRFKASDALSGLSTACTTSFPAQGNDNIQSKTTSGEGLSVKVTSDRCTDVAGNTAAGIDSDNFQIDKTAPSVSSTDTSKNATGVAATDNITATFIEEVSGINESTLTIGFKLEQVKPTGNVQVGGNVTYDEDEDSKTATFNPDKNLAKGLYRVTLTGIEDNADNVMPDYTWTFATAGPPKR
jgi:hypothetical protein